MKPNVVILGAGVTGLASAYALSKTGQFNVHVIEKETEVGGVCRSFRDGEFILDHGPHKFYTLLSEVEEEFKKIMGDELLVKEKKQSLYLKNKYFTFPLKMSEMLFQFPLKDSTSSVLSFGLQTLKNFFTSEDASTYEAFLTAKFGSKLYKTVFEPMAYKIYGDPRQLDRRLAEVRVSSPGLLNLVWQLMFSRKVDKSVSAPTFLYPKKGFGRIPERLKELCEKQGVHFHLDSVVSKISVKEDKVSQVEFIKSKGELRHIGADYVVYTLPINLLSKIVQDNSDHLDQSARHINFRNVIIQYYLLRSKPVLPSMWVFFPESQYRFGRLSEMTHFSEHTVPEGHSALMVDFTCDASDPLWSFTDEALDKFLAPQLQRLNLFTQGQVVKTFSRRFSQFYPVYEVGFERHLQKFRGVEERYKNLFLLGRLGDFNYNNSDQCLDMGFQVARKIMSPDTVDWHEIRQKRFEQYKIVD